MGPEQVVTRWLDGNRVVLLQHFLSHCGCYVMMLVQLLVRAQNWGSDVGRHGCPGSIRGGGRRGAAVLVEGGRDRAAFFCRA